MAGPQFPNVPIAPGVPPVLRVPGDMPAVEQKLNKDSSTIDRLAARRWGIFTSRGATVLDADNVVSVEHAVEYRVADYPLEGGKFESYNKVATPFEVRVAMSKGGTIADRTAFLKALADIVPSLDRYNVVTPEATYLNATIVSSRLTRNAGNGAGLVTVEVGLQEIREAAAAAFSNTKAPSGAAEQNNGSVQAVALPHDTGFNDPTRNL